MSSLRVVVLASLLALTACDLRPEDFSGVSASAERFHTKWTTRIAEVQAVHDALVARLQAIPADTSGAANATTELNSINAALSELGKTKMVAADAEIASRIQQRQKHLAEEAVRHGAEDLQTALSEVNNNLDVQRTMVELAEKTAAETKKTQDTAVDDNALAGVADIVEPKFGQKVGASDVLGITFKPGTAELETASDDTKAALMRIVALASGCEQIRLSLVGHTAKDGDPAVNQKLSTAQADAVRQYLIGSGIAEAKLAKATGVGGTQPAAKEPDAGSDEEKAMATDQLMKIRARNRRITVKVETPCPAPNPA